MFRGGHRDPLLPTAGPGSRNGGSFGNGRRSHPARPPLSKSFIATAVWATVSLMLIASGYLYCKRKVETASVNCDADKCQFVQLRDGVENMLTLPRELLVRAELVRVKNGEIVSTAGMRRSKQTQLGHSYAIVYAEHDSEDDDDESYDSYEDDDDSYDSYDDKEDSSEDEKDEEVDIIPGSRPTTPKAADRGDKGKTGPGESKKFPNRRTPDENRELQRRREELRSKEAEARAARGAKPLHEPDKPPPVPETQKGNEAAERQQDDQFDRFPGDAGTMEEVRFSQQQRNSGEIRRMQGQSGGASESREEYEKRRRQQYEEASRMHTAKLNMDMMTKQMGNNLHDRAVSPDDPDNRPQDKPSQEPDDEDMRILQDLEARVAAQKKRVQQKTARSLSAFGGFEEVGERSRYSRGDEERAHEDEFDAVEFDTTEGVLHTRARGGRRLLSRYQRTVTQPQAKAKTESEIKAAAVRDRNVHHEGHGHHHKKARNMAKTEEQQKAEDEGVRSTHHHKAFHHKKDVPLENRHHVHHQYHHKPGQAKAKVPGGWQHQNRQWHPRELRTLLATRYNLGRKKATARKKQMEDYIFKRGVQSGHKSVSFSDSKRWRAGGLWLMIVGLMSLAFCLVIGDFRPRLIGKKAS